jgi:hypothetical protein
MSPSRVFILASQPLFAEGVQSLISSQSGIEVVGVAAVGPEAVSSIRAASPDVVIVEAKGEEQGLRVAEVLEAVPQVRVVALTPEDNRLHIYYQQMRQGRRVEDLLEAIREPSEWGEPRPAALRLFVLFQGAYGRRILDHIRETAPTSWSVEAWRTPSTLPQVVYDALAFLPSHLPTADLVLSLGEDSSVAQLLPSVAERTGARAIIVPVDDGSWLPEGLIRLLRARLMEIGVMAVFPKPFCSLGGHSYNMPQHEVAYESPWVREFARHFGRPVFRIACGEGRIARVEVERDTACGCARAVAWRLVDLGADEAVARAGVLHRQYPCLAGMRVDPSLGVSLLQAASGLMQDAVARALGDGDRSGR